MNEMTLPLSVTEAPHNIESLRVSWEETFCFFETWTPEWGSNARSPTFQAGSFNRCTRAPALTPIAAEANGKIRTIEN